MVMADLFSNNQKSSGEVECFGKKFPNDAARRDYFLQILAEKLKDPAFRKIEGFPIGSDQDILALSDPPDYTACPNPFTEEFVRHYGRPYSPDEKYEVEPFASDVSAGNSPALKVRSESPSNQFVALRSAL